MELIPIAVRNVELAFNNVQSRINDDKVKRYRLSIYYHLLKHLKKVVTFNTR